MSIELPHNGPYCNCSQDNVVLGDKVTASHALLCGGVTVHSGAVLQPGVVLSYGVVIGAKHTVPGLTTITLCKQLQGQVRLRVFTHSQCGCFTLQALQQARTPSCTVCMDWCGSVCGCLIAGDGTSSNAGSAAKYIQQCGMTATASHLAWSSAISHNCDACFWF